MPTSAFLLARLDSLRFAIIKHLEFVIETSQTGAKIRQAERDPANDRIIDETIEVDESQVPSLAQTQMDQVRMNLEVEGLIKKCEDLLTLSRVLKEGWLFGGLDTLQVDDPEKRAKEQQEWDEAGEGLDEWLRFYFRKQMASTDIATRSGEAEG
jgi:hypothetical protein